LRFFADLANSTQPQESKIGHKIQRVEAYIRDAPVSRSFAYPEVVAEDDSNGWLEEPVPPEDTPPGLLPAVPLSAVDRPRYVGDGIDRPVDSQTIVACAISHA
jgi:hypothetical protein